MAEEESANCCAPPHSALAVAVLRLAVIDAVGPPGTCRDQAREFLSGAHDSLRFWVDVAGLPYATVRMEADAAIGAGTRPKRHNFHRSSL